MSQKIELFVTTAMRTSNPTKFQEFKNNANRLFETITSLQQNKLPKLRDSRETLIVTDVT
jgi:hypothetical protein